MLEACFDFADDNPHSAVFCIIVGQSVLDAHSVEGVLAREDIKLPIKDGLEAKVTHLTWIDRDVLVLLLSVLLPQVLCTR